MNATTAQDPKQLAAQQCEKLMQAEERYKHRPAAQTMRTIRFADNTCYDTNCRELWQLAAALGCTVR